jgi:hypothetical protein
MSSLSDKQWEFAQALQKLLAWAARQPGYKVTLACARCAKPGHHTTNSFHYKGLAIDLNLFIDGAYQRTTKAHDKMGRKWRSLGGTWGGDFEKKDGNHYSWGETSRK